MNTNQKQLFWQQSKNKANRPSSEILQKETDIPIYNERTSQKPPDENRNPTRQKPGKFEANMDDLTLIDEETPIFSNY